METSHYPLNPARELRGQRHAPGTTNRSKYASFPGETEANDLKVPR